MIVRQFLTFSAIGVAGFVVDTATLYTALQLGAGLYTGRLASYLVAATTTWALNRRYTFSDRRTHRPAREWARFLAANSLGGVVNYGTYAALVASLPLVAAHPWLGVAAGSLAGLAANFTLSRRLVFTGPG